MKKILSLSFLILIIANTCPAQSLKSRIERVLNPCSVQYMKFYEVDTALPCDQSKALSIIYKGKISKCFSYRKTFNKMQTGKMINLLKDKRTYGGRTIACFDTNCSVVFFNKADEVVGYVNFSFSCNGMMSAPQFRYALADGIISSKEGFSTRGRGSLLRLLELIK
jgi:hypothetical protein